MRTLSNTGAIRHQKLEPAIFKMRVRTIDGRYAEVPIPRYFDASHQFILHRSIRFRGWTITHRGSRDSLVQRLPTLTSAYHAAGEFCRLTDKWGRVRRPYDLWREMHEVFNTRELFAVATYVELLRKNLRAL